MNEKNYLIQFEYGKNTYSIPALSHCDFTKGSIGDKLWLAETIEDYIKSENIHVDGVRVNNVRLFAKDGELVMRVDDFSSLK